MDVRLKKVRFIDDLYWLCLRKVIIKTVLMLLMWKLGTLQEMLGMVENLKRWYNLTVLSEIFAL